MGNEAYPEGVRPPVDEPGGPARTLGEVDTGSVDFPRIQASPEFTELRRKHRSFVFPLAIAFLLWYFLYVLLADYAHGFMATRLFGNINVGLVFGLLQFATTFGITAWYVSYANRKLDPAAGQIRAEIEGHDFDVDGVRR